MKAPFYLALLLLLAGCSGKPGEGDIKRTVSDQLGSCSSVLNVENFQKTNGRDVDDTHYLADVSYDVVLASDVDIPNGVIPKNLPPEQLCVWQAFFQLYHGRTGIYPAGTKMHIDNQLSYVKTEKGWIPG